MSGKCMTPCCFGTSLASKLIIYFASVAVLSVLARADNGELEFSLPEDEKVVFAKENLFLTCKAPVGATVHGITWLDPQSKEIFATKGRVHIEHRVSGSLDLVFESIQHSDKGLYQCTAQLDGLPATRDFKLQVLKPITFVDTPIVQYAPEGSHFVVKCAVEGDPSPTVHWKPKYPDWYLHDRFNSTEDGFYIKNITRGDAGEYRCTALQQSPKITDFSERIITLIVKYMPEWKNPTTEKVYSYVSGTANLTCKARGEPYPEFRWTRNNESIFDGANGQFAIHNFKGKSVLELYVHNESDFGDYSCLAENEMGLIQRDITLRKGERPATPSINIIEFQPNSIELDVTASRQGELKVLSYKIQYKLDEEKWSESLEEEFHLGAPYVIKNLEMDRTYVLRVAARNAAGWGEFSDAITQRTLKMQAEPVADMGASAVTGYPATFLLLVCVCLSVVPRPVFSSIAPSLA